MAHEFKKLLLGIRGNAELLINSSTDILSKQDRSLLKDIERAGTRAQILTNQMLSFSRKRNSDATVFDVNRILMDYKRMLEKAIHSETTLNIVASADPALIFADEAGIQQVVLNLVLNAHDAMPDGGTVTIQNRVVSLVDSDVPQDREAGVHVDRFQGTT